MEFDVLGPVRVRRGKDVVAVSGTLRRLLLSILLANANEPVSAEFLLDALWGQEFDPRGAQRLQLHVHRLRILLDDPERLSFGPAGYCLRVLPEELDAGRFDRLVDEAGAESRDARAADLFREALGLWRGRPYRGVDASQLVGEVQRLTERRLVSFEELFTAELRLGRDAVAAGELSELVHQHPLRERLHWLLMAALYRSGRRADALAAYRRARELLVAELGLEPGPELRALEGQILAGEPVELSVPSGPAGAGHAPAQLPHRVTSFVGREQELAQLDRLLTEGGESVLISAVAGTAGVGKTALAVRWAHRVRDQFPDGQLYVDLRGYGPDQPVSPDDALASFLRALGVDGAAIDEDPTERAARFRTLVDRKRLLIVLDNARSADQVRPLLPGTSAGFVVITSRDNLTGLVAREGAHRIDLDRLTPGEARRLLKELLEGRYDTDGEAVDQLISRCACLPLALRIAAERIREHPHRTLEEFVDELADEEARLDLLDGGEAHASVRAVFASSYRHLDADTARLFRLVGLHPGHDIDAFALTALSGSEDHRATRRWLDALVRANLVEETDDHRFHLHDLLWTYAAELAASTDPPADRQAALARLFDHYTRTAWQAANIITPHEVEPWREVGSEAAPGPPTLHGYDAARRWLEVERTNLLRASELAAGSELSAYALRISTVLFPYLDLAWYFDDARQLQNRALGVARDLGDRVAEGIALRSLGVLTIGRAEDMSRADEARRHLEDALALHEEAQDQVGAATTLNYLGALCGYAGRVDEAVRHLQRSVELYRLLDRRLLAHRPLSSLGLLRRRLGEHEEAFACLREALAIADEGGHRPAQAHALHGLAGLCRDVGRYDESIDYARRALRVARETGIRRLEGLILNRLGTVHRRLGDHQAAQRHHHQALRIARAISATHLEAMALNGSAEAFTAAGQPVEAARCHVDALAAAAHSGPPYEEARAHTGLGDAHEELGEHSLAVEHWRQALDIYRVLQTADVTDVQARLG